MYTERVHQWCTPPVRYFVKNLEASALNPGAPTHLGMPNVQIAVGLGWEARHDPPPGGREVLSQLLGGVCDAHNAAIAEGDRGVNLGRGGPGNHRISTAEW